jgi:tetratricopeptide (TPR) repeat protein
MMLLNFLKKSLTGTAAAQNHGDAAERYEQGLAQFRDGAHAAALATMQEVLQTDPGNADVHHVMAKCHQQLGDSAAMHSAIAAALAANGNHLATHQLQAKLALPGPSYPEHLAAIHRHLQPRTYLEIGVAQGLTIALAHPDTLAIGVDPEPQIQHPLGPNTQIFALPSDGFFARGDLATIFRNQPLDLAFIDGMHNFEFALRDFINTERMATRHSTILVHDTYPLDRITAEHDRKTLFWSGPIWRSIPSPPRPPGSP